jgi:hypothetical protein
MEPSSIVQLASDAAARVVADNLPPALMPLPRTVVTAELWIEERHVRLHGDAVYAVHKADGSAWWAVVVHDSNTLEAGSVHLVALDEIRCESPSGRRG